MLRLLGPGVRLCDGRSRREILRIGGLGFLGAGLSLADLTGAEAPSISPVLGDSTFGRAKSCILLFLMGGPPQHSTWDPKPDAPAEVRGEFGPISTKVPGLSICELMPKTATVADKICILRAVSTRDNAHSSSGYYMLTGRPHQPMNFENANPGPPNDAPSLGAMLGRLRAARRPSRVDHAAPPDLQYRRERLARAGRGVPGRAQDPWLLNAQLTRSRVPDPRNRLARRPRSGSARSSQRPFRPAPAWVRCPGVRSGGEAHGRTVGSGVRPAPFAASPSSVSTRSRARDEPRAIRQDPLRPGGLVGSSTRRAGGPVGSGQLVSGTRRAPRQPLLGQSHQ